MSSCYLFSICPICSLFQFSSFYGFKNYAYFMILLYLLCSSLAIALVILVVYSMHLVYYTICQVILYHFPMLYKRLKLVTFISPSLVFCIVVIYLPFYIITFYKLLSLNCGFLFKL